MGITLRGRTGGRPVRAAAGGAENWRSRRSGLFPHPSFCFRLHIPAASSRLPVLPPRSVFSAGICPAAAAARRRRQCENAGKKWQARTYGAGGRRKARAGKRKRGADRNPARLACIVRRSLRIVKRNGAASATPFLFRVTSFFSIHMASRGPPPSGNASGAIRIRAHTRAQSFVFYVLYTQYRRKRTAGPPL